jgi:hypothetical protein
MEGLGFRLRDHKIVVRDSLNKIDLYKPNYQHFLAFTRRGTLPRHRLDGNRYREDVWEFEHRKVDGQHVWPDEFVAMVLNTFTEPGDLVCDPFAGVGPVPYNCERLERRCIAIELDPEVYNQRLSGLDAPKRGKRKPKSAKNPKAARADRTKRFKVREYEGVQVVRDDLIQGGTKLRYLLELLPKYQEAVCVASPAGASQLAIAYAGKATGVPVRVFIAGRKELHARTLEAERAGAVIVPIRPGHRSVVEARASEYAESKPDVLLLPGLPPYPEELLAAADSVAHAAENVAREHGPFDEVWVAAGGGLILSKIMQGMAGKVGKFIAVQVGHPLAPEIAGEAEIVVSPYKFNQECKTEPPFPSCPNYDAKAWEALMARKPKGRVLFWNVCGPSPTPFAKGLK